MKPRNTKTSRIRTRFGPETRFDVPPQPLPFKAVQDTEFEKLKRTLLQNALMEASRADLYAPLRRAANEAASLAWATEFPVLLLPELFAEMVTVAIRQTEKQRLIRSQTESFVSAA